MFWKKKKQIFGIVILSDIELPFFKDKGETMKYLKTTRDVQGNLSMDFESKDKDYVISIKLAEVLQLEKAGVIKIVKYSYD